MRVKVTGYIEIEDDEYDAGPDGPLTPAAYDEYFDSLPLDDITFEEVASE